MSRGTGGVISVGDGDAGVAVQIDSGGAGGEPGAASAGSGGASEGNGGASAGSGGGSGAASAGSGGASEGNGGASAGSGGASEGSGGAGGEQGGASAGSGGASESAGSGGESAGSGGASGESAGSGGASGESAGSGGAGRVELRSISIDPSQITLPRGLDGLLTVVGIYSDGSMRDVTTEALWESSAPSKVSVVAGQIKAKAVADEVPIFARLEGLEASATVTVGRAVVIRIEAAPALPSIAKGTDVQVWVTAILSDGSTEDVTALATFSSANRKVATVTVPGVVTGVAQGATQIMASLSIDGALFQSAAFVTVTPAELVSLRLDPDNLSLPVGLTENILITGTFSDGTEQDLSPSATFSTEDASVVAVNAAGTVKALAKGTARITVRAGAISASLLVSATDAILKTLALSPDGALIHLGTELRFQLTGTFSDGSTLDLIRQAACATDGPAVSTSGIVQSSMMGDFTLTCTLQGRTIEASFAVDDAALVSLAITSSTASLPRGSQAPFTATGFFSDGSTRDLSTAVIWTSSNASVVRISSTGLATGIAAGTATISATVDGKSATFPATVSSAAPSWLSIESAPSTIPKGGQLQLKVLAHFTDWSTADFTNQVTFTSANAGIASVGPGGLVSGITIGGPIAITASMPGVTAGTITLTVTPPELLSISIRPVLPCGQLPDSGVPQGFPLQLQATGRFTDGTIGDLTGWATWASSNPTVIALSGTTAGIVTPIAPRGTSTITAGFNGIHGSIDLLAGFPDIVGQTLSGPGITQMPAAAPWLSPTYALTVAPGVTLTIRQTYILSDGTTMPGDAIFTSSNPGVFAVDSFSGMASAVHIGTAAVTLDGVPNAFGCAMTSTLNVIVR